MYTHHLYLSWTRSLVTKFKIISCNAVVIISVTGCKCSWSKPLSVGGGGCPSLTMLKERLPPPQTILSAAPPLSVCAQHHNADNTLLPPLHGDPLKNNFKNNQISWAVVLAACVGRPTIWKEITHLCTQKFCKYREHMFMSWGFS